MRAYAGVDFTLTLRSLQNRLQTFMHGQPYVRGDFITQSGLWIWPLAIWPLPLAIWPLAIWPEPLP